MKRANNRSRWWVVGWAASLILPVSAIAAPVISEFMASGNTTILDEDGDTPDWIEIHNPDATPVSLDGWFLTDDATDLTQWSFPAVTLPPAGFLVIFASSKNRAVAGAELHANFKLSGSGEYLGLIASDGSTVVHDFSPTYPAQVEGVSWGFPWAETVETVVANGAACRIHVPTTVVDDARWTLPDFDDDLWTEATTGIGYDRNNQYDPLFGTNGDVEGEMWTKRPSCYIRIPFVLTSVADITSFTLKMKYDDGFAASFNGLPVTGAAFPEPPTYNSTATENRNEAQATTFAPFNAIDGVEALVVGSNMLAVQAMNIQINSSDLLMDPELEVGRGQAQLAQRVYLTTPSPGTANGGGTASPGPRLGEALSTVDPITPGTNLVVWVDAWATAQPIDEVRLYHRVMYGSESVIVVQDDGVAPDETAGDGRYTGALPTNDLGVGEMLRWRFVVEDTGGQEGRSPLFPSAVDSPEYWGTMAADPSIESALPVLHWFIASPNSANNRTGTRGSVYYEGQFYDNVQSDLHGQSTSGFPKKSYDFDFNSGHRFTWAMGEPKLKDFNLITNWADKSKVRNTLAYELLRESGLPAHFSFPVRVQQNGAFFSVADLVEDGDDRYLDRAGLDAKGVLYKMYNTLNSSTSGVTKKTRQEEDNSDLQALINGLNTGAEEERKDWLFDHLDVPRSVNYYAGQIMTNNRDYGHKNYYLYRDTEGTGEWTPLMWDVDLSYGRNWVGGPGYFDDTFTSNPLKAGVDNALRRAIYDQPIFYGMLVRRVRTIMDAWYGAPGSSGNRIDTRLNYWEAQIDVPGGTSDADRDYSKWGSWGNNNAATAAIQRIRGEFLPTRRTFLYVTEAVANGGTIPEAQSGSPTIQLGTVDFNPASGSQDEEFVELINPGSEWIDLSGWSVAGGVRHTFIGGTVLPGVDAALPGANRIFLARDSQAFRARSVGPTGGAQRFIQGGYAGQLSARGESLLLVDTQSNVVATLVYPGTPTTLQEQLRLTELHIEPLPPTAEELAVINGLEAADFEFIEVMNIGTNDVDLALASFVEGVTFSFPVSSVLASGSRGVLVRNPGAFLLRYGGGWPVMGIFTGRLDNNGETVQLQDPVGENVHEFAYDPAWTFSGGGTGVSMTVRDPAAGVESWETPAQWRSSALSHGSPGWDDTELVDEDGDALPDGWEQTWLGSTNTTGVADGDGDGVGDGAEYVLGFLPGTADGVIPGRLGRGPDGAVWATIESRIAGGAGYAFRTRVYTVETCNDLAAAHWEGVPGFDRRPADGATWQIPLTGATRGYVRVVVELMDPY